RHIQDAALDGICSRSDDALWRRHAQPRDSHMAFRLWHYHAGRHGALAWASDDTSAPGTASHAALAADCVEIRASPADARRHASADSRPLDGDVFKARPGRLWRHPAQDRAE